MAPRRCRSHSQPSSSANSTAPGSAEFEPDLQRRIVRVQRQTRLVRPDPLLAARDRARRVEPPAEQRALGDALAGEVPDHTGGGRTNS